MKEKQPSLDSLRDKILAERSKPTGEITSDHGHADAPNTLEKFEALPIEEQVKRMEQKGYSDLDEYKKRHYRGHIDINKLRDGVNENKTD